MTDAVTTAPVTEEVAAGAQPVAAAVARPRKKTTKARTEPTPAPTVDDPRGVLVETPGGHRFYVKGKNV